MSITTAAKNAMLDALDVGLLSLHTGFPGTTGANEVTGGSYARVAVTFGTASGGQVPMTGGPYSVDVPATTVRWAGLWNAAGTTLMAYSPDGGNPQEFIVDTSTDVVTCQGHGYSDTATIVFYGGVVPGGLVEGTVYYVRDATADTFKVAATSGGAAIDLTSVPAATCVVSAITETVYGSASTHSITGWTLGLSH